MHPGARQGNAYELLLMLFCTERIMVCDLMVSHIDWDCQTLFRHLGSNLRPLEKKNGSTPTRHCYAPTLKSEIRIHHEQSRFR